MYRFIGTHNPEHSNYRHHIRDTEHSTQDSWHTSTPSPRSGQVPLSPRSSTCRGHFTMNTRTVDTKCWTLSTEHSTRNSRHYTLNTRHPSPTLHPQPSILNPQPSTLITQHSHSIPPTHTKLSTRNHQHSTLDTEHLTHDLTISVDYDGFVASNSGGQHG